ncbi:hypothetical protein M0R45_019434 [Rubus argutus]|uniref:Uncharacterized protein n=1 Tax=Rubus argutus TaxID=59490 RepID=A0AAW1X678_RUBAR
MVRRQGSTGLDARNRNGVEFGSSSLVQSGDEVQRLRTRNGATAQRTSSLGLVAIMGRDTGGTDSTPWRLGSGCTGPREEAVSDLTISTVIDDAAETTSWLGRGDRCGGASRVHEAEKFHG